MRKSESKERSVDEKQKWAENKIYNIWIKTRRKPDGSDRLDLERRKNIPEGVSIKNNIYPSEVSPMAKELRGLWLPLSEQFEQCGEDRISDRCWGEVKIEN